MENARTYLLRILRAKLVKVDKTMADVRELMKPMEVKARGVALERSESAMYNMLSSLECCLYEKRNKLESDLRNKI